MKPSILVIEDEPGLVMGITDLLHSEGYEVESCLDGEAGFIRAKERDFDAIILDVMLPGKGGFDICRDLRAFGVATPILMLTARGQLIDKVLGLKLGADDFVTKPFESPELLARIEALLRRTRRADKHETEIFCFGNIRVDNKRQEVTRGGKLVEISAREFELLNFLIGSAGVAHTRQALLQSVWGYVEGTETRTVDMHIMSLRQKLEVDPRRPRHFITIRGYGYKFDPL